MSIRYEVVTSVVTAAVSYDLTTLAVVKDELEIPTTDTSKDTFLARAITDASAMVAAYCNNVIAVETLTDVCYLRRVPAGRAVPRAQSAVLQLSRWPVTTLTSVIETDPPSSPVTLTSAVDYLLRPQPGEVLRLDSTSLLPVNWSASKVAVRYAAGYATIPGDVVAAMLRLVTARFKARGRDPMLRSEGEPGVGQQQYWVGQQAGQTGSLAPEIASILDNYRVPVTA